MLYPHKLTVTRPTSAEGSLDQDTGIWTPAPDAPADTVIYSGQADVQDPGSFLTRDQAGMQVLTQTSDVIAYLGGRWESVIRQIKNGDQAEVTWEDGTVETFTVIRSHHIDGSLTLRGGEST